PPEAQAVDQLVTAARLAEWGRRAGDPAALIVAARIIAEVPLRQVELGGRMEGGQPSERAEPAGPSGAALLEEARRQSGGDPGVLAEIGAAQALLLAARALAQGDPRILGRIGEAEAAAARGVVNSAFGRGPIQAVRDIEAQATYWFELNARGGEVLRVAAV